MYAQRTIDKDINRTDRTHPKFAADDSEGLSDLRAILYAQAAIDIELGRLALLYIEQLADLGVR